MSHSLDNISDSDLILPESIMGNFQSTEKKSPAKTVKEDTSTKSAVTVEKTPQKGDGPENTGPDTQITVSPPKSPSPITDTDLSVTEEEMASVEASAKKIRDSVGGTSLEIVLSPAIKKVM